MKNTNFRGSLVALVTPFTADGEVDVTSLKKLLDFQLENGTDGLVMAGTTGEGATLSPSQFETLLTTTIAHVAKRVPVIAGTGSNNTRTAIRLSQEAEALGADGLLIVGPYYNKPTQEGYYQHFATIANRVTIPIIVYNVPGRTSGNIAWQTVIRLAALPNIVAVKECSGSMVQVSQIIRHRPSDFAVLSGDDALTLPIMALGGDGVTSVVANETPRLMSDLVHAALAGDYEKARQIHHQLLPLMTANFIETNPIPVKCAMSMMGLLEEHYQLPLTPINNENRSRLRQVLMELDLV
jgi:4-hydroxy-tetrahydrodipicolinate synthase